MKDIICECGHEASWHGDDNCYKCSHNNKCFEKEADILRAHIEKLEAAVKSVEAKLRDDAKEIGKLKGGAFPGTAKACLEYADELAELLK